MELRIAPEYTIAARLADPVIRGKIDFSQPVDWASVLKILIKNRIPLVSLKNDDAIKSCPLLSNPEFIRAVDEEMMVGGGLREQYGELRQALLQKGIPSILFKSSGLSPSFPYTSDNLDTLVHAEDISQSREVLNSLGYVELRNIEEPQKWLFRKFRGGESISAIHLHGVVGWGVPFLDDPALWKRARMSPDDPLVMIPSPEDAILVTIAHAFYENKAYKLLDIARIRHCLHQGNLDFDYMKNVARVRGWEDGLAFFLMLYDRLEEGLFSERLLPEAVLAWAQTEVSKSAWLSRWFKNTLKREKVTFPFRVSFFLGKVIYYQKVLNDQYRSVATRWSDFYMTIIWGIRHKARISGQRGMIVSLSGIDGAGKTVHGQSLVEAFETSEIKARVYWSRFGSSAQKIGSRQAGRVNPTPSDISASLLRRRQRLQNPLIRSGWMLLNLTSYILRSNLLVRIPRWFGQVIVCDRYLYDAIVEVQASLPDGSRWPRFAERLLAFCCPHPDIAWLLDVPAEMSLRRQPEQIESASACEELSKQRSEFISIAPTYGLRILPNSSRLDQSSSELVRETLRKYYEDYGTLVNALLLSNPSQRNPVKGT